MAPRGFTILEMLIVLVVIGLIMGVLMNRMGGIEDQKRIETGRGDLRAIQTAIHAYYLNHHNAYPDGTDWQTNDLVNDDPRILRQVLYDPFRAPNTEYAYLKSSNGLYYVVFSYGPNGTQDIIGIDNNGILLGQNVDDIYVTNGQGFSS